MPPKLLGRLKPPRDVPKLGRAERPLRADPTLDREPLLPTVRLTFPPRRRTELVPAVGLVRGRVTMPVRARGAGAVRVNVEAPPGRPTVDARDADGGTRSTTVPARPTFGRARPTAGARVDGVRCRLGARPDGARPTVEARVAGARVIGGVRVAGTRFTDGLRPTAGARGAYPGRRGTTARLGARGAVRTVVGRRGTPRYTGTGRRVW